MGWHTGAAVPKKKKKKNLSVLVFLIFSSSLTINLSGLKLIFNFQILGETSLQAQPVSAAFQTNTRFLCKKLFKLFFVATINRVATD